MSAEKLIIQAPSSSKQVHEDAELETVEVTASAGKENSFNAEIIKRYPNSNKKVHLNVARFSITGSGAEAAKTEDSHSVFISPQGLEFKTAEPFEQGTLLKIHINIPDYWMRKQRLVDYSRIDNPGEFRVLAKVVKAEEIGKRSKKKSVTVQTLIIDEVDEQVLKAFLQES